MQKWEYLTLWAEQGWRASDGRYWDAPTAYVILEELGREGWELVTITNTGPGYYEWHFKRPIED
jgi:hypothetical protein